MLAAVMGWIVGVFGDQPLTQANIFNDFVQDYLRPLLPSTAQVAPPTTPQAQLYSPTVEYEAAVIRAVESASPGVVSIIISKDLPIIENCPYDPFANLPDEFRDFFGGGQFTRPCERGTERREVGGGSGFVIDSGGLIVTNRHVVNDTSASYTVLTNDGKRYDATVVARDQTRDFAVVKINATNLSVLSLGNSDGIKLGQTAIAIGNALGEFRNTVSVGSISGLARDITASGGGSTERIQGVIQTDTAINQGNSGGPLLNLRGEVIGINVATVSGAQNIGFAIPINQVKSAIESVKQTGRIVTPYMGVRYISITPALAEEEQLPVQGGALIRGSSEGPAVITNSPAAKAGLRAEDIVLELGGEKITAATPLASLIQKHRVGETVDVKILREGREMNLRATLEERRF